MQTQNEMTVTKDPKIWMEDGNIVLRTTSSEGQHCFKCHRSILASYSPVFADMFSVPQTDQSAEKFEGVDVVDLPDAHEDVWSLLHLMYDSGWLILPKHRHLEDEYFIAIGGVLRLATKYEMSSLRAPMITLLEAAWPANLDQWDEREKSTNRRFGLDPYETDGPWIEKFYPEPA